jgi:hypothetical protein
MGSKKLVIFGASNFVSDYAWPIFRRMAGHLVKRRFGVMRAELRGGLIYLQHVLGAKQQR